MKYNLKRRLFPFSGLFVLSLLFISLIHPGSVYARQPVSARQNPNITIENAIIDIWPEYDKPSVLVIYHVTLSSQVTLPVTMNLRIPSAAGKPYAVAWQSADKALYDLNYDPKPSDQWTELEFSAPALDIQVEYYDPSLKKSGAKRDFTFRWLSDYPVKNLVLQIQQPANAIGMTIQPAAGSGQADKSGIKYYSLLAGKVDAGKPFDLSISYNKPDDTLTNPQQFSAAQPNQPVNSATSGRITLDQLLPWGLGGVGVLLIIAGLFWYWRTGRVPAGQPAGRLRHNNERQAAIKAASTAGATTGEGSFCHQCGKKASPGDTFCRACGTRLR